ncbi:MAG: CDP-alcohol phosphatidyltransferase family protein [Planctomycetes bacterium]|nr:CDP-alcohol phosphatidyltransferase family protein [Planctomycetota bacterium]MCH9723504.1 CDP-alcohol phosphatidyltransferase family protein [Planctomycetota bacterium]MCH9775297.1 CDP-alcohol phosphatidyltransferase family protein [Planctomycetota bacterium]MCH9790658.1 CDP-alcohol phosphatidyltransferase family protein [Planctomycetota bacterium]
MASDKKNEGKVSVYARGEQSMMDSSQAQRHRLFLPLLNLFVKCGITPNHLTIMSFLSGLGFCFTYGLSWHLAKPVAFGLLLLHVLLDGIDGPLARLTGTAGNRGSFTDTTSDQLIVAFTTMTLIHYGLIHVIPGSLYLFFYTLVVVFAMIRSSLAIPYSWLIRPRLIVYAWFPVEVYLFPGTLNYLLWFFTSLLAWKSLTGFYKIRKKL